ncbi:MAG: DNA primase [Woeseia sp.]|nr:DNA primase [Woeseia sp.]MBT8095616.1 DNA primase [Woeseia sp.]NNE62302.1 DNA primase [Woeseia sp.]NNL54820.1 DNA primase [Woeseia sp.]
MSGRIPQHFIDDLIARADIVEVMGRHIQLKKAGREFKACCPFHDEKTPSFTVSPQKGFYHCFGCGAHGTALGFLMEYEHLSFVEAVEALAGLMGLEVPREEGHRPARRFDELYELLARVDRHYQAVLRDNSAAVEYLKNRGIDGATAKRFGVGFAPSGWSNLLDKFGKSPEEIDRLLACGLIIRKDNGQHYDRFRDRIMFPIRDSRGRVIGFGGRVTNNEEPKYLNSPETALFHKGRELYGLYEARQAIRHIEKLVVVEGYMDVIGLARHGIDFGVATLGTATTEEHLNRLFRLTDDVYFCFDGDRAGRQAAWRALETALTHMREGRQIRFVFLPEGEDPDSFVQSQGTRQFEAALDGGMPLSDFMLDELASEVDPNSVDGRARLAESAKPLIGKIPEGFYRELLLSKLAETVGLSTAKIEALIRPIANDSSAAGVAIPRGKRRSQHATTGGPSVVRRAISLLLHAPESAMKLDATELAGISRPGVTLLHDLIETVQEEPDISTAGLLERFRQREDGRHLGKLASTEIPLSEDFDPAAELSACMQQLRQAAGRERIEFLIEKERLGALTEDQKEELRGYRRHAENPG